MLSLFVLIRFDSVCCATVLIQFWHPPSYPIIVSLLEQLKMWSLSANPFAFEADVGPEDSASQVCAPDDFDAAQPAQPAPKVPRLASIVASATRRSPITPGQVAWGSPGQAAPSALGRAQTPLTVPAEEMGQEFMDNYTRNCPKQVRTRLRFKCFGHGLRIRDCDFCCSSCNSADKVFDASYHLWNHLEDDGATVQGFECFWCAATHRLYYPGFKHHQLKDHIADPENKKKFDANCGKHLEMWKPGGPVSAGEKLRVDDTDKTNFKDITSAAKMRETFHMGRELIFLTEQAFTDHWKATPQATLFVSK